MIGAGDDRSKFTTSVIHACQRNDAELRLTAGEQQRDFIYIEDVQTAYATLLNRHADLGAIADIDVGSGQAPTIREFVGMVHRITRSKTLLSFGAMPYRPHEAMLCRADLSRMNALGWKPRYDLEAAVQKTIELEFNS
jgi:nucleoside-diphosphate-sugar epimerase